MTLATGRRNKSHRPKGSRQQGFTLIEMILVMALLVVAVSMVSPRLSGFIRGRALESEARRVLALTHAARSRAISESMPVLLWLDATVGRYGVERETRGKMVTRWLRNSPSMTISGSPLIRPSALSARR